MNTNTNNTNNNTANTASRIDAAHKNIQEIAPGYWKATVASRTAETAVGSFFKFPNVEEVLFEHRLKDWEEYPDCPGLLPGCSAFKLNIKGYLGVIPLASLDDAQLLRVINNKGTGVAKLLAPKESIPQEVDFAVCILGLEDGREVIFTFHPGDPIPPDTVKVEDLDNSSITVAEAKSLGFVYANLA